jgi:hypothetical protein
LQEPQLTGSVNRFAQELPHAISLLAQVAEQRPPEQKGVAPEQAVPQAPQFIGSEVLLTQASPQAESGDMHAHAPDEQDWLAPHFLRHMPQLLKSVCGSMQD